MIVRVHNLTKHTILGDSVFVANTPKERVNGLLDFDRLNEGEGLLIPHCKSIHTIGMKFPIDVVFLDENNKVLGILRGIRPGVQKAQTSGPGRKVLELPAGKANDALTLPGDQLAFVKVE